MSFFSRKNRELLRRSFRAPSKQGGGSGIPPVVALATLEAKRQGREFPADPQALAQWVFQAPAMRWCAVSGGSGAVISL